MKITRLPRGNAQFPEEKDPGDLVMLSNGDIFTWCQGMWALVGGRFLKSQSREWVMDYLKGGWPTPREAEFDLPQLLSINGTEKEDRKWAQLMINNLIRYSEQLTHERIS